MNSQDFLNQKIDEINASLSSLNDKNILNLISALVSILSKTESEASLKFLNLPELSDKKILETDSTSTDKKTAYAVDYATEEQIDFKYYKTNSSTKSSILWLVDRTPNFEDDEIHENENIGIDFIFDVSKEIFIIVLSNRFNIRILPLTQVLNPTAEKIIRSWYEIGRESSKEKIHASLWNSFDLMPINIDFYKEISEYFDELVSQNKEVENIELYSSKLIGRLLFLKFLEVKDLVNKDKNYFEVSSDNKDFLFKIKNLFKVLDDESYRDEVDPETVFIGGSLFEETFLETKVESNSKFTFPENFFLRFMAFRNRYNFTTDESTSSYEQIAVDPEMLGRILENLLAKINPSTKKAASKRNLLGAYYTPRMIVDYMCVESIKQSFSNKFPNSSNSINLLTQCLEPSDFKYNKKFKTTVEEKHNQDSLKEIANFLDKLKILDPACGSGAFPIGMLQVFTRVYKRVDPEINIYTKKLEFIENCIFGSDIDPIAIETTKLRTILSLIVDSDSISGLDKIYVPNLDFKFIAANSLGTIFKHEDTPRQTNFAFNNEIEEKITKVRVKYFHFQGDSNKRNKYRKDFEKIVNKQDSFFETEDLREIQLKSFNPFSNETCAMFLDSKIMFGIENFDIVISNPPYVDYRNIDNETKKILKTYEVAKITSMINLYLYFFELGFNNLNSKGVLCYITPQQYLAKDNASSLRDLIRDRTLNILADFARVKVFKAATYPFITIISNSKMDYEYKYFEFNQMDDLSKPLFKQSLPNPIRERIEVSRHLNLLEKISKLKDTKELQHYLEDQHVGPGSLESKNVEDCDRSYGPLYFVNKDLRLFRINSPTIRVNKELYPISQLEKQNNLRIYTTRMTKHIRAAFSNSDDLVAAKVSVLYPKDEIDIYYLLGILNSKLLSFWYYEKNKTNHMQGEAMDFDLPSLGRTPIRYSENNIKELSNLVQSIINLGIDDENYNELNDLVNDIYELSEEEKTIVNKFEIDIS